MATSSSYDFSVNSNELVAAAYRTIGIKNPAVNQYNFGAQALNMMIKLFSGQPNYYFTGHKLWRRSRASMTLKADDESYSLKPSGGDLDTQIPIKIISAVRRNSDNEDSPMKQITFEEYEAISDKKETKTPTMFYYERGLTEGLLYLDGYADDVTETVQLVILLPLEDIDAGNNDFDFPAEWYEPLKYNLAIRLAAESKMPVSDDLKTLAKMSLDMAAMVEQETTALFFQPKKDDD